jgi:hypothetical protein
MANTITTDSGKTYKSTGGASEIKFIRPSALTNDNKGEILVEGIYVGSVKNEMSGKDDQKFQLEDGSTAIINGAGNLGARLKDIPLNTAVLVRYGGRTKMKSGKFAGKEVHNFDVLVAE